MALSYGATFISASAIVGFGGVAATFGMGIQWLWKGATRQGVLASLFAMLFLHKAEAAPVGLCKALFGQDVLIDVYPWYAIDPILFALPLSTIAIVLVSLVTQKRAI